MTFNVISRRRLSEFWSKHPQAEAPLTAWYTLLSKGHWTGPQDLKATFGSVDFVADNRAIFDVGGNKYRVIVRFAYAYKVAQIKFVGSHDEYNRIDAVNIGGPAPARSPRKKKARALSDEVAAGSSRESATKQRLRAAEPMQSDRTRL